MQKTELYISNRTVIRVMIVVVLTILGLGALSKVDSAFVYILTAFFLALALNAPVHWLSQHLPGKGRGSRTLATTISFLIVIAILIGFISLIVPPAVRQVSNFVESAPELVRDAGSQNSPIGVFIRENNLEDAAKDFSQDLTGVLKSSGGRALSTVGTIGSGLVAIFSVLALTFMMLVEGPAWVRLARRLVPEQHENRAVRIARDMYKVVRGYINGQVTVAAIAALMIFPVMLILEVPYAGALAPIVFICGLIPMIGHIIGAAIVTTIALFNSVGSALLVLAFYILYQQIENYVVQPKVQANATNMSPLTVFIAVLVGANFSGLLGALLAIPIAGCLRILVIEYLQSRGTLRPHEAKAIKSQ